MCLGVEFAGGPSAQIRRLWEYLMPQCLGTWSGTGTLWVLGTMTSIIYGAQDILLGAYGFKFYVTVFGDSNKEWQQFDVAVLC